MSSVWIICGVFISTLCATVKPSTDLSIEDTITSLKLRVNAMEAKFSSMESTESLVRKVKEELVELVQNSEIRCLEEKDDLTKKIEGIESSLRNNQKDVSEKLQAIEHTVQEHKGEMTRRLSEVQMTCKNEFQDVSGDLENLKNKHLMMDNRLLMELQQVQKKSFEAMEKVGTVKEEIASALERERSKTVVLQVKLNETRETLNSFLSTQQNVEDLIRKNITSAAGSLQLHINESLKSGLEKMQSNLSAERRRMENSLSRLETDCANSSYVTKLGESLRNFNLETNATLHSIYTDLHSRVTQLEERNDRTHEVEEIMKSVKNHTHEISTINRKLPGSQNSCEGEPPSLVNGKSIDFERTLGSKVQYECDKHFVMTRNSTVRCVFGEWEGELPVCKYFDPTFYAVSRRVIFFDCYSRENSKNIEFQLTSGFTGVGVRPQSATSRSSNESNGIGYHNVAPKDIYGVHRCGFNTEGRSMDIDVIFQTHASKDPLHFLETFQVANAGDTVEIRLHTNRPNNIRWKHNGVLQQSWEKHTQVVLRNVQPTHAGIYFCYFWPAENHESHYAALMRLIVRKCGANLYGEKCDQKCPPCYNGGVCHDVLGICVCPLGFYGHNCERACPEGHYGTDCSNICETDKCIHLYHCKPDPYGCTCARGFKGTWCSESCDPGWYGAGCRQPCHCKNGSSKCNIYTGACSEGCMQGWTGESCQIKDPERQRVIIHLKDVNDEPPYFINRPLPMQAVVELNAPPGTPVFKLQARDPDTDHNIHYFLVRDRTGGRFEVDERSGEVRTLGSDSFMLDKEYVLYVKAEDHNGMTEDLQHQSTGEERLSIMGGKRPPQFYMQNYEATIPENQRKDSDIIEVKAKSFADREIRYILRAQGRGAGTFNIGPTTGVVKLAKDLDYEDLRQPKSYWLIVTATEDSGGFSTSVELKINVTDVNENAPPV